MRPITATNKKRVEGVKKTKQGRPFFYLFLLFHASGTKASDTPFMQ